MAVRSGNWKLHIQPPDKREKRFNILFDLDADTGETTDVAAQHPEVVRSLQALAEKARKDMGNDSMGPGVRPIGTVEKALPFIMPHGVVRLDARPPGS